MSRLRATWRGLVSGTGWLLHWWPGALLATVLALLGVLVGWSHSAGSFQQTLRWAQAWADQHPERLGTLSLRLDPADPPTALIEGGRIAHLAWSQGGLNVEIDDFTLTWTPRWWLALIHGDGLQLHTLSARQVTVHDQRTPTPTEPLQTLTLPLPVSLPFEVGHLQYQGSSTVALGPLRGHYRHDSAQRHHLRLDELTLAQGHYHGELTLDGQAPMALQATLQGEVTVPDWRGPSLQARATLKGPLAGADAQLQLDAELRPTQPPAPGTRAPQAEVSAQLRPWVPQPVHSADVRVAHIDLAALWPAAPRTGLSGRVHAQPSGTQWRAEIDLDNSQAGPWDRQRLPVERLRARVQHNGERQWAVEQLAATAGQGQLTGQAVLSWGETHGRFNATGRLDWTGLHPAALWSTLPDAPLDVQAEASGSTTAGHRLTLQAKPGQGTASTHPLALRLADIQGQWQGDRWTLERLRLALPQAQLEAEGQWHSGTQTLQGQGRFSAPGTRATWQAALAPDTGEVQLDLQVPQAERLLPWLQRVAGAVLSPDAVPSAWSARDAGSLALSWQGGWQLAQRWWAAQAAPTDARTRLNQAALPLTARLQLPSMAHTQAGQLSRLSDGVIELSGSSGRWHVQQRGQLNHQGQQLRVDQAWTVWPEAQGPRLVADQLRAEARLAPLPAALTRWQVAAPNPLVLRWLRDGFALEAGGLDLTAPDLDPSPLPLRWDATQWLATSAEAGLRTSGHLRGLPLRWLDRLAQSEDSPEGLLAQANLQGDMLFDARWQLRLPATGTEGAQAEFALERRSGDLALRADPNTPGSGPLAAGVAQALLGLRVDGDELSARLRWESQRAGQAEAVVRTRWTGGLAQPTWPTDAPLAGRLKAALPQVGLWSVLAPPGWRMSGSLLADAELDGTRAEPLWSGQLRGDGLALRSLVEGIEFAGGELRASLRGESLLIDSLKLEGPGGAATGGQLRASGSASWAATTLASEQRQRQPVMQLQAQAERLRVSVRADRRLTVSGDIQARLQGKDLQLRGGLSVDQAAFVLPDEQTPRLGDDVVVRGRSTPNGQAASGERVVPDVLLKLRLGDNFQVRGHGLDTRLAGDLELRSTAAQPTPRLLGEVRTVRGTYRAYGQRLDIEQGVVRFAGPYDNPALDVLAIRPFTSQRVGVQIRGTAQAPQVRLYSDPELPDSEKLAWLVLGRSASGGGAEAAVLQQAAIALLSGGSGASPLDGLFGLDEISVRGAGETTTNASGETVSGATITLGKRLSNRLYVAYERSLVSTLGTLSLFYDVSKRLTLRARTGEDNAVDLIFTLPYD